METLPRDKASDFTYLCDVLAVSGWEPQPEGKVALWSAEHAQIAVISVANIGAIAAVLRALAGTIRGAGLWYAARKLVVNNGGNEAWLSRN